MTGKMAVMMTGVVLAMSAATLPASANASHINTQDLSGREQQTQVLAKTGSQMRQLKWSLDEKGTKVVGRLTSADRATFNKFKAGIKQGFSPRQAAKKAGATEAKSTSDRYEERMYGQDMMYFNLSKKGFVTLRVDRQTKVIKVLQVGSRQTPIQTSSYTQPLLPR